MESSSCEKRNNTRESEDVERGVKVEKRRAKDEKRKKKRGRVRRGEAADNLPVALKGTQGWDGVVMRAPA